MVQRVLEFASRKLSEETLLQIHMLQETQPLAPGSSEEANYQSAVPGFRSSFVFPLGTALVLFVIFAISAFFSCCHHWAWPMRSGLLRRTSQQDGDTPPLLRAPASEIQALYRDSPGLSRQGSSCRMQVEKSCPVLMPGDDVPQYVAWPTPLSLHMAHLESLHPTKLDSAASHH